MKEDNPHCPSQRKFQALIGSGGACVAVGMLISFTVVGLPVGILLILVGIVLLAISPLFKARHLIKRNDGGR